MGWFVVRVLNFWDITRTFFYTLSTTRAPVLLPRRDWPSEETMAMGSQVGGEPILPAVVRARSNRFLLARLDDGAPEAGVGRVLAVQLREEANVPSLVYGVSSLVSSD